MDGSANVFWDLLYTFDVCMTYDLYYTGTLLASQWTEGYVGWNRILTNYTIAAIAEYCTLGYYRVGSINSKWQFILPPAPLKPQYPAAENVNPQKGLLALFDWTAF
jgi:hypothetical protein